MADIAPKSGISGFLWGWSIRNLTTSGVSHFLIELVKLVISIFLIVNFPSTYVSANPLENWIGAVLLAAIALLVLLPSLVRVLYGNFEHFVEDISGSEKE